MNVFSAKFFSKFTGGAEEGQNLSTKYFCLESNGKKTLQGPGVNVHWFKLHLKQKSTPFFIPKKKTFLRINSFYMDFDETC